MEWSYSDITRKQTLVFPVINDGILYGLKLGDRKRFHKYFKVSCFNSGVKICEVYAGAGLVNYFEIVPAFKVDSSFKIEIELE